MNVNKIIDLSNRLNELDKLKKSIRPKLKYGANTQSSLDNKSNLGAGSFIPQIGNTITDVSMLTDNNKSNNSEAIGGLVGTAVDTVATSFGIPTFGLGNKLGRGVGSLIGSNNNSISNPKYTSKFSQSKQFELGGFSTEQTNKANNEVEIENDEYVFNPNGIDDTTFQMIDNNAVTEKSDYGFLVKGNTHKNNGITVLNSDAYIASNYLGIDGNKATNSNPSVAKVMLKNGGSVLAKGSESQDRFGINKSNPNALKHHLETLQQIANESELNKQLNEVDNEINNNISVIKNQQSNNTEMTPNMSNMANMTTTPDQMLMQESAPQNNTQDSMIADLVQQAISGDQKAMQKLISMLGEEKAMALVQEMQNQSQPEDMNQSMGSETPMMKMGGMTKKKC
jgi:hypothetical protein